MRRVVGSDLTGRRGEAALLAAGLEPGKLHTNSATSASSGVVCVDRACQIPGMQGDTKHSHPEQLGTGAVADGVVMDHALEGAFFAEGGAASAAVARNEASASSPR